MVSVPAIILATLAAAATSTYILPFEGFRNATTFYAQGRVLKRRPPSSFIGSGLTAEMAGETVLLDAYKKSFKLVTDEEGYYEITGDIGMVPLSARSGYEQVSVRLEGDQQSVTQSILVPGLAEKMLFISDVDDTILETHIPTLEEPQNIFLMTRNLGLRAELRRPVAGTSGLYSQLRGAGCIFYVSAGPRNAYEFLRGFQRSHSIPLGPVFLQDFGTSPDQFIYSASREYKPGALKRIIDTFPDKAVVLIGDTGQSDASIYADMVKTYGSKRIPIVLMRDVSGGDCQGEKNEDIRDALEESMEMGVRVVCGDDWKAVERQGGIFMKKPEE